MVAKRMIISYTYNMRHKKPKARRHALLPATFLQT